MKSCEIRQIKWDYHLKSKNRLKRENVNLIL